MTEDTGMPLFTQELNDLADRIKRSALTCYLHTSAPSDADKDAGKASTGGTNYTNGVAVSAADISRDSDGDLTVTADIDFGAASANVGTVTHWSLWRDTPKATPVDANAVAFGTLPSTQIDSGDSFKINANSLSINGTTT